MCHFLHILDIHGQVMREVIHFNIATHTQPRIFPNDVKFFGFFFVFKPLLKGKTRSIISHLKVNQHTPCAGNFLLKIKDHTFKDNAIFLGLDVNHLRNLCLVQLWSSSRFSCLKIRVAWFFLSWWWCHLLQRFDSFESFIISRLHNLFFFSLESLDLFLSQGITCFDLTVKMRKAKLHQLLA